MEALTRGELAQQGRVNAETIRYYERRGLLPKPPRTPSGYRVFSSDAVRRVRFIKRAQGLGFSLKEIKALLALRVDPCSSCGDVRKRAEAKIGEIEARVRMLLGRKEAPRRLRVGLIARALSHAKEGTISDLSAASGAGRRASLASVLVVPGIVASLLPSLTCPLCWPAYAGVLSALGVWFVGTTSYLLPLTATFLAIAVGALTFGARRHGRHGPLALGLVGSAIVLLGKFVLDATAATLGGVGMLVAASVWNVWPRRATVLPCPACVPGATGTTKATVTELSS